MDLIEPVNISKFRSSMTPYESYKYGQNNYIQVEKNNLVDPNNVLKHILKNYPNDPEKFSDSNIVSTEDLSNVTNPQQNQITERISSQVPASRLSILIT